MSFKSVTIVALLFLFAVFCRPECPGCGSPISVLENRSLPCHRVAGDFRRRDAGRLAVWIAAQKVAQVLGWRLIKKRINLKYNQVSGLNVLPDIQAIPTAVDLAVIAAPMATVSGGISGCAACGIAPSR